MADVLDNVMEGIGEYASNKTKQLFPWENIMKQQNEDEIIEAISGVATEQMNQFVQIDDGHRATPLMIFSKKGMEKVVELLLERGAIAGISTNNDNTALVYAVVNGNMGIADILMRSLTMDDISSDVHILRQILSDPKGITYMTEKNAEEVKSHIREFLIRIFLISILPLAAMI